MNRTAIAGFRNSSQRRHTCAAPDHGGARRRLAIVWGPTWSALKTAAAYTLKQDAKFWIVMAGAAWIAAVFALTRFTGVNFDPRKLSLARRSSWHRHQPGDGNDHPAPAARVMAARLQSMLTLDRSGQIFVPGALTCAIWATSNSVADRLTGPRRTCCSRVTQEPREAALMRYYRVAKKQRRRTVFGGA